jgi:hypothetical protein
MRIVKRELEAIDYRMNLLGIRVWKDRAQLIARSGDEWTPLGPARELPLQIPKDASEIKAAASDTLLLTAYQYDAEHKGTDLREALAQIELFVSTEIRTSAANSV